jgi:hypothetical protein
MRLRLILPGLFALVLIMAACAPPPNLRDESLLQDTSLIDSEPCAAPCWRGIIPGVTTWSDARTILEDDTTLQNLQIQQDENSNARAAIWEQKDGSGCCQMFSSEDGELVNVLFLRTAPNIDLEELFGVHGEPTYAVSSEFSDDQAIVNLIYPDVPMVIYAFVAGPNASLTENSEVIAVLYLPPEDMELVIQTSNLHAWEGYADFQTYSSAEGSAFEVTPSVTLTPTPSGE